MHIHSDIIPSPAVRMAHHSGRLSTLAINALACQAGDWRRGAWVHGAKARRSRDTWPEGADQVAVDLSWAAHRASTYCFPRPHPASYFDSRTRCGVMYFTLRKDS